MVALHSRAETDSGGKGNAWCHFANLALSTHKQESSITTAGRRFRLALPENAEQRTNPMPKQVLFLCSGNYYRSRFAEHLFNWLAPQFELAWRADSRGLLVGQGGNIGPISKFAEDALAARGIPLDGNHRDPEPLTRDDLSASDLILAVKETEHRPAMVEQFPDYARQVEYWDVDDLDCEAADNALPYLEEKVRALVTRLKANAARPDMRRSAS